ncbi:MAG TPA: PQQ-binding-like beta-propeller repeat protein, partial [Actinotalea sp.]|nr:PQQ-binding-like beta-propeller repeat protein [Actinotalea sp.]
MRQRWPQPADDVETLDVILVEDEVPDEFLALLHEIALDAIALRATSPGDPRPEIVPEPEPAPAATDGHATTWLLRRLGRRRVAGLAVLAVAALAVAVVPGVLDDRRAAARLAALTATPSVLASVTGPPVEQWRASGRVVGEQAEVLVVASALDGTLQRLDPATGVARSTVTAGADDAPAAVPAAGPTLDEEYDLPGGFRASWSWDPDGDSGHGSVTRSDGGWAFGLWGPPLVPEITDESEAGTLVVLTAAGDRLLGRDLRTGRSRWSVPYRAAVPVRASALVDGVMLLDDGAAVTAIDVRTGSELWSASV